MPRLVSSRSCTAACGGKIEWLDHGSEGGEDRYELRHEPSGGSLRIRNRSKAKEIRDQLIDGVDSYGVLPSGSITAEAAPAVSDPAQSSVEDQNPRARAQVKSKCDEVTTKSLEEQSLELSSALEQAFPWHDIVERINDMLSATDVRVTKDGQVLQSPNWYARKSAIELLLEYKAGKTFSRPEPKVNKKIDGKAFEERLKKSPAFLQSIESILSRVKQEADNGA